MELEIQKQLVFSKKPEINLVSPATVNKGILRLTVQEYESAKELFLNQSVDLTFVIPASGSGSRMFEFLHNFFYDSDHRDRNKVERFLNSLDSLALSRLIPQKIRTALENGAIDLKSFAAYIVDEEGLGLGLLPKGLIPFHENNYFVLNPFQEHMLQICRGFSDKVKIHFTINKHYEEDIKRSINLVKQLSYYDPEVSFSEQNPATDSFVFAENQKPVLTSTGEFYRRPAGHGALLENLNRIKSRYLCIKNIDNIQHFNHDRSASDFAMLGGVLLSLNQALLEIYNAQEERKWSMLKDLNDKYQLFLSADDFPKTDQELREWMNRPKRVCGMVKNEGQAGGGPFWVEKNGRTEKQIVEKAQISQDSTQLSILLKSTHFNPVMIVCDTYNLFGERINLLNHADPESYMVVEKSQMGKKVYFIERPGLWNGSMAQWISVFVEISADSFSPVKDVLNLLDAKHRP
jgi:hypothetical protein